MPSLPTPKAEVALARGERQRALAAYDSAIRELERMQDQIMVEFRSDFLADKDEVYVNAVDLCLEAQNPRVALGHWYLGLEVFVTVGE